MSTIKTLTELLSALAIQQTGSRYIESPPKEGTDDDYLVLVENLAKAEDILMDKEWAECDYANSESSTEQSQDDSPWSAWRHDDVNVILTDDDTYYMRFAAATEYCKTHNIKNKELRIAIFRAVKFSAPSELASKWVRNEF